MHESKLEELDLEAALNFRTNALGNAGSKTAIPKGAVSRWSDI
jgi:hypothetical protein